jgi:hypothetical protein
MEVMVICDELGQAVSAKGDIPRVNPVIFRVKQSVVEIQSAGRLHLGAEKVRAE